MIFLSTGTRSTEHQDHHTARVQKLARGTAIFLSTGYAEYRVPRAPYSKGTEISTWYDNFSEHGVRGVRSTKSTKVRASIPGLNPWS